MASNYVSKFSGVEIDKAVAYYNAIQTAGRKIIEVAVKDTDWKDATTGYMITITLKGISNITGSTKSIYSPTLYFLDEAGDRWEINYNYTYDKITGIGKIICYSNAIKAGTIIIMGIMSDDTISNDMSSLEGIIINSETISAGNIPDVYGLFNNGNIFKIGSDSIAIYNSNKFKAAPDTALAAGTNTVIVYKGILPTSGDIILKTKTAITDGSYYAEAVELPTETTTGGDKTETTTGGDKTETTTGGDKTETTTGGDKTETTTGGDKTETTTV